MKEYIIRPRGGGKTTEIVKKVMDNDAYLLTFDETERRRLLKIYPQLKDKVFSWKSLPDNMIGRERKPVYIDNADYWLAELVPNHNLAGISLNID